MYAIRILIRQPVRSVLTVGGIALCIVLMLFLLPVGGGIPAGVLLARAKGMAWPVTAGLYLAMSVPLGYLSRYLERRWGKGR